MEHIIPKSDLLLSFCWEKKQVKTCCAAWNQVAQSNGEKENIASGSE